MYVEHFADYLMLKMYGSRKYVTPTQREGVGYSEVGWFFKSQKYEAQLEIPDRARWRMNIFRNNTMFQKKLLGRLKHVCAACFSLHIVKLIM